MCRCFIYIFNLLFYGTTWRFTERFAFFFLSLQGTSFCLVIRAMLQEAIEARKVAKKALKKKKKEELYK